MRERTDAKLKDIEKLIKDCAAGKAQAQAKLYHMFSAKMYGVCLRYAKNTTEAEDSLQEGFIKVFTKIKSFRGEGSLEGWIRRIMVNVSLERYRKQHLLHPVEDVAIYEQPNFSDDIIAEISANDLLELVQELPPRYQMVFNLYVIEGMTHQEIAQEMDISEGTSKSNLARARGIMKQKVQQRFGELKTKSNSTA